MPRRKSQPAKYYHSINDISSNDNSARNRVMSHMPERDEEDQDLKDLNFLERRPFSGLEILDPPFTEACRSEETLGSKNNQSCKPSPRRRRMVSPKKENSFKDNSNRNVCKTEDVLYASFDFKSKNGDQIETKMKHELSQGSKDNTTPDISVQENSESVESQSTGPKTLQDFVYHVIDLYYRYNSCNNSLSELRGHKRSFDDKLSSRQESYSEKSGPDIDEMSASPESLQDTGSSSKKELKLSELEDEVEKPGIPATASLPLDVLSYDTELKAKKNGSISSSLDQCGTCFKILKRSSMREHMDRHNDTGRYRCEVCHKTFSKLSSKGKHELIHTDQRPFRCDQCDKAYRQKIHLVEHRRSHTGERPFVCPYCSYTLASKSLLNRHLKTHEANKQTPESDGGTLNLRLIPKKEDTPKKNTQKKRCIEPLKLKLKSRLATNHFDCGLCHSQFMSEKQLSSHLECEHPSDASFKCSKCSSTFPSARGLTIHINDVHKSTQPYPCTDCNKGFAHSSSLLKHRVKEHGHRSSSLVQVLPTTRKSAPDNGRHGDKFHLERNGNNSDTAVSHDKLSPVPLKVPRLSIVNGNEDILDSSMVEKSDTIPKHMTSNCELTGSDM